MPVEVSLSCKMGSLVSRKGDMGQQRAAAGAATANALLPKGLAVVGGESPPVWELADFGDRISYPLTSL